VSVADAEAEAGAMEGGDTVLFTRKSEHESCALYSSRRQRRQSGHSKSKLKMSNQSAGLSSESKRLPRLCLLELCAVGGRGAYVRFGGQLVRKIVDE